MKMRGEELVLLRIGIIGAGRMGRTHAYTYRGIPQAQVKVVCDVDVGLAEKLATEDWSDILVRDDIDAVSICLPDHLHRDATVAAARAGKHILLEKPISTTVADGVAIIEAAAASDVTFMVGHTLRFDPRYYLAYEAIAAGQIGEVQTVYARRMGKRSRHLGLAGRVSLPFFLGVHDFDALRWFVGSEVEKVTALGRRGYYAAQGFGIDDAVSALLQFANGVVCTVDLAWNLPDQILGFQFKADVIGDKGWINVSHEDQGLTISTNERIFRPDTVFEPMLYGASVGVFHAELEHFVECTLTGSDPVLDPRDALEAVRITIAVEQSARTGEAVWMDAIESL
jgi:UDP-N-acetylglucosamine 3-dehydrogenase